MSRWLIGDIARVSAHAPRMLDRAGFGGRAPVPVNDTAHLTVEFANGAEGVMDMTTLAHLGSTGMRMWVVVDGDAGSLELEYQPIAPVPVMDISGIKAGESERRALPIPREYLPVEGPMGVFSEQPAGPRLFVDSILDGFKAEPGFEAGLGVQKVIDAALRSHQERRWVEL